MITVLLINWNVTFYVILLKIKEYLLCIYFFFIDHIHIYLIGYNDSDAETIYESRKLLIRQIQAKNKREV